MALFQRRKRDHAGDQSEPTPSVSASEAAEAAPAGDETSVDAATADVTGNEVTGEGATPADVPNVQVGVSVYKGIGVPAGPTVPVPDVAAAGSDAAAQSGDSDGSIVGGIPDFRVTAPRPAAEASTNLESVPGIRDNVLLRDALAGLNARPSGDALLGVVRQLMQGHVFLRVPGDARELVESGGPLPLALLTNPEGQQFVMLFSSGRALGQASLQGDELGNAAIAQPVVHAITAVLAGNFHGVVLDHASAPHRAVLPREVLQKAFEEADPNATLKTLLAAPRTEHTADHVVRAMRDAPMWVAIKAAPGLGEDGRPRMGIAESRTANGDRFVEVFSHPIEVAALGRGDRAMKFSAAQLAQVLRGNTELGGALVDPGGPWILLGRDALAPLMVLADETPA